MEKLAFQTNVPIEVQLQFLEGKPKESNFGGTQHMFSCTDGRVFFVSETVGNIIAAQLKKQNVRPGEPVEIMKAEVPSGNGRKSIQWQVYKVGFSPLDEQAAAADRAQPRQPAMGEQTNGTFVVPAVVNGGVAASAPAPAPVAVAAVAAPITNGQSNGTYTNKPARNGNGGNAVAYSESRPQTKLEDALKTVVAAVHGARQYAEHIGYAAMPQFTSEDIRTMANTLMIQSGGGGGR